MQMVNNPPVRFIISGEPGSIFDGVGRALVNSLQEALGTPMVVENVGDTSGVGGAEAGASAVRDGLTLLLCNKGAITSHPHTAKTYQPSDFVPLCQVAEAPIAIAVKNDGRFDSLEALFKAATASSEGISFSTPNPYHTQRLALAGFARQHDITFKYVQLPGGNDIAIKNLVAGKVDFAFLAAHNLVKAREAGDLKILGVAHPQRLEFLPDDPTFMEQGYELATAIWLGLFARAGSPADILDKLRTAAESAASSGPVANQIRSMHMVPTFIDSKSFEKKVAADTAFHLSVLKHLGAL